MKLLKTLTVAAGVAALSAGVVATAHADGHAKTKLRIQTHFSQETLSASWLVNTLKTLQLCQMAVLKLKCSTPHQLLSQLKHLMQQPQAFWTVT